MSPLIIFGAYAVVMFVAMYLFVYVPNKKKQRNMQELHNSIAPGDVIMADIDGVIVVPRAIAVEVLEKAEAIRDNEVEIKKMVLSGLKATEIVERGGYF